MGDNDRWSNKNDSSNEDFDPNTPENKLLKNKDYIYKTLRRTISSKAYWLVVEAQTSHGLKENPEIFQKKIESILTRLCYTAMKRLSYRTRQEIDILMSETEEDVVKRYGIVGKDGQ